MVRTRLVTLAAVAGLGLACGCLNLSNHPLFGKKDCCGAGGACCETGCSGCVGDGAILADSGPLMVPPGTQPPGSCAAPVPQAVVPPLAPPPDRLVPQPQAQPAPYSPR